MEYFCEAQARELVVKAGHMLLSEQLISRTWGNISVRISENSFVITPSGRAYDTLRPEDLPVVSISDLSWEGPMKPSSEKGVHAAAYALRGGVSFIVHTHQFYASAVCAAGENTPFAPCAGYGLPGTKKLIAAMRDSISANPDSDVFLMARHGALCLGDSLDSVFEKARGLERDCRALFESRVTVPASGEIEDCTGPFAAYFPFLVHEKDPLTVECSHGGRLRAYIDDFAQIVGPDARCCAVKPNVTEFGLRNRYAVMVRDRGALCTGPTADDADAAAYIMRKNCAAALYCGSKKPLSYADSYLQRVVYLKKYSRQKDA